ncbi:MAG: insulinase family protein, partial [Myxococcota bacterium]
GYGAAVAAVQLSDTQKVIGEVYPAREELVFVLIGNADAIRETAKSYGTVTEMSIKDPVFSPMQ